MSFTNARETALLNNEYGATALTADVQVYIGVRIKTPGGRVYTIFEGTLPIIAGTTQAS